MWEATDLGSEDLLWAATNLMGGIAGQRQAVCGAVSSAAVFLGLRHRVPIADKARADKARQVSREKAAGLVQNFARQHGTIICSDLLGIDFSDAAAVQRFRDSGQQREKCGSYLRSVIKMLYELEGN
jgi:C_GCAxxG_C_C family probable redox protein